MLKFLPYLSVLVFTACEIPQYKIPTIEDEKEMEENENDMVESNPSSSDQKNIQSFRPLTPEREKQDSSKKFEQNGNKMIKGTPKHPFPSENPFE